MRDSCPGWAFVTGRQTVELLIRRTKRGWFLVWPFLLTALIIAVRNPTVLARAEFWAEDADVFFIDALNHGVKSVIMPVVGVVYTSDSSGRYDSWSYFLVSRVLAFVASLFPVVWTPFLYALFALAFNALATGYFSRAGFTWLIESRSRRIFACIIFSLAPGASEVFTNLVHLPYCLTFLASLLILEKPFTLSIWKFVSLLILLASAGQLIILAPLVIFMFWMTRNHRYVWLLAGFLPMTVIGFIGSVHTAGSAGLLPLEHLSGLPRILLEQGIVRLLILPFFGRNLTGRFMMSPDYLFWAALLCSLSVFIYFLHKKCDMESRDKWLVMLAYICMVSTFGMIGMSRNYALDYIQRRSGLTLWGMRYAYLPGVFALLVWFSVIARLRIGARGKLLLQIPAIAVICFWTIQQWNNFYRRPDHHWPETAVLLQKALDLSRRGALGERCIVDNMQVHPYFYHHANLSIAIEPGGKIASLSGAPSEAIR